MEAVCATWGFSKARIISFPRTGSSRYGVFLVGGCSRTQPLKPTPVDLSTLDGSACSGAGGTLIGRVSSSDDKGKESVPVRNAVLTFRDWYGKPYVTHGDDDGIYELRHVPPGPYTLDSRVGPDRYASGGGEVALGVCRESSVQVSPYSVTGRLRPGIAANARVLLKGWTE